ncbi:MAG: hypothetical protein JXR86_10570 [Spirochaetales bacterium]|nr:hypothetical protein [Spirochaetales bacterium]
MKRSGLILILLCIAANFSLSAVDHFMMELGTGVMWVHSEAYGKEGPGDRDPDPIIFHFNLNFPLYFSDVFYFSPGLGISGNWWQYVETEDWAMPVDQMFRDLYVLYFDLDLPVGFQINFSSFSLTLYAGPQLNFRIPLWGENEEVREDMTDYLLSDGSFFNVLGGLSFVLPLSDRIAFIFRGETHVPIHNLWNDVGLPFADGLTVSASAGARFIW